MATTDPGRGGLYELVTSHSLTWLATANGVGMLLATLLLFPELGRLLEPFSYGRWMPLHLDLQLYGWCSLPLVGLLLRLYQPATGHGRLARPAVGLWSGALLFGAISWLAGETDGKLFLDWAGSARQVLAAAMAFLAVTLWAGWGRQVREPGRSRASLAAKGLFLAGLSVVPAVLFRASQPDVYPPINPDSGGATGWSLLGSTLGIVVIFFVFPFLLGLASADGGRTAKQTAVVLGLHLAWFAVLDHSDHSNRELGQVVALSSLVIWLPLLVRHLRRFAWPAGVRPWLTAFGAWGGLLLATGVIDFLPGVLERVKFTSALVAHAHVAMAGMVTCFNVIILEALLADSPMAGLFAGRRSFFSWQAGCGVLVAALLVLGVLEAGTPGILYRPEIAPSLLLGVRWIGGLMMAGASVVWLVASLESSPAPRSRPTDPGRPWQAERAMPRPAP